MALYVLLPIETGVNTTKPAETLKKFFSYSAHFLPMQFPIWYFRKQAHNPIFAAPLLFRASTILRKRIQSRLGSFFFASPCLRNRFS